MLPAILIVDDAEEAVPALQIALETCFPCEALHFGDVGGAILELERSSRRILAVITDLQLPRRSGEDLIEWIRNHYLGSRLPVIVISANTDPATPRRMLVLGADAFFSKPFSPAELCRRLQEILHAQESLDAAHTHPNRNAGPGGASA